jgi:acetyl-CoA carboxylase biotin carboxyl carrier protein
VIGSRHETLEDDLLNVPERPIEFRLAGPEGPAPQLDDPDDERAEWGTGEPDGPASGAWSLMDFDDIERILALVREHELAEFELERDGLKLRVRKAVGPYHQAIPDAAAPPPPIPSPPPPVMAATPVSSTPTDLEPDVELAVVKSPIVGTFYRSTEPGAPPFVDVGERVKKDQVLCIIEAMKLMNEITSEYEGEIVSVYVENGKPVQYGERLFAIKTS